MAFPIATLDRQPLENGDRLSRDEFHARYAKWPELKHAELIDGVVHLPSPVHIDTPSPMLRLDVPASIRGDFAAVLGAVA